MESAETQVNPFPYGKALVSVICWSSLYFALQYFNWRKSCEWNCRIITTLHALVSAGLASYSAFVIGPNPIKEPGLPLGTWEHYILVICLGYFLYDLFWCFYHQTEGGLILIHHIASVTYMTYPLWIAASGGEVMVSLVLMESTNPILQLRWFLRESGYKDSIASKMVDVVFICMFFTMRMVGGSYVLWSVVRHPRPTLVSKMGGMTFMLISYGFMYMIFRYAYRKYIIKKKRPVVLVPTDTHIEATNVVKTE